MDRHVRGSLCLISRSADELHVQSVLFPCSGNKRAAAVRPRLLGLPISLSSARASPGIIKPHKCRCILINSPCLHVYANIPSSKPSLVWN